LQRLPIPTCKQRHSDAPCRDCNRIRVERSRHRHPPAELLEPTVRQTRTDNAARYVRMYLQRGAIAPPDACERCEVPSQIAPSRPLRPLLPFHPDPAQKRLVAWLCADCRRRVRATGESFTLSWTWPGITAPRSRKPPDLPEHVAAAVAALDARLPAGPASAIRDAALVRLLVAALAPGERERLYAAGCLVGPRWQPTADVHLDTLLRSWVFTERAERGTAARAAGGTAVMPLPAESRRQREPRLPPPAPEPRPAFDPEEAWAALHRAAEALDVAEAAASEINARIAGAVRDRFG
jgi:hypothetical protein